MKLKIVSILSIVFILFLYLGTRETINRMPIKKPLGVVAVQRGDNGTFAEAILNHVGLPNCSDTQYVLTEQYIYTFGMPDININNFTLNWNPRRGIELTLTHNGIVISRYMKKYSYLYVLQPHDLINDDCVKTLLGKSIKILSDEVKSVRLKEVGSYGHWQGEHLYYEIPCNEKNQWVVWCKQHQLLGPAVPKTTTIRMHDGGAGKIIDAAIDINSFCPSALGPVNYSLENKKSDYEFLYHWLVEYNSKLYIKGDLLYPKIQD